MQKPDLWIEQSQGFKAGAHGSARTCAFGSLGPVPQEDHRPVLQSAFALPRRKLYTTCLRNDPLALRRPAEVRIGTA